MLIILSGKKLSVSYATNLKDQECVKERIVEKLQLLANAEKDIGLQPKNPSFFFTNNANLPTGGLQTSYTSILKCSFQFQSLFVFYNPEQFNIGRQLMKVELDDWTFTWGSC